MLQPRRLAQDHADAPPVYGLARRVGFECERFDEPWQSAEQFVLVHKALAVGDVLPDQSLPTELLVLARLRQRRLLAAERPHDLNDLLVALAEVDDQQRHDDGERSE